MWAERERERVDLKRYSSKFAIFSSGNDMNSYCCARQTVDLKLPGLGSRHWGFGRS